MKMLFAAIAALASVAAVAAGGAAVPYSGTRYATDAYPGFDSEDEIVNTSKKTPRWIAWLNGPSRTNAVEQLAYAVECQTNGAWRAARRGYDALVREWPTSPEAPVAQEALARMLLEERADLEGAFFEYKYLLDYYPSACDFDAIAAKLYEVAGKMREAGKDFLYLFHFANTVEVRRAYEAVVLRAPGAPYAPDAMLAVASLREDEGDYEKAVKVYETLRSLYSSSNEAMDALRLEGSARMKLLRMHSYNASRCRDTIEYLRLALASAQTSEARADLERWLAEADGVADDEAYASAKFYDSRTRTRQSAVSAYERYLTDRPAGRHAAEARARLAELKGGAK
ncbi:MAG: hypothetical protein J6U17_03005 [Kiritimatiellae bacterium]|nr:hypothetical protein [Kiritimatiellia bacterium]